MHSRDVSSPVHSSRTSTARSVGQAPHSKGYAPIALFVYSRPEHTRLTVESLRRNDLARESDLFIFADAPKDEMVAAGVQLVRNYIHSIDGFRSVTCIEREKNFGLSGSIVNGVTQLCGDYGRAIAVEDDILTASDFLTFLNQALEKYAEESKILSVSGFNYPIIVPESYPYDAFCTYRFPCWGWGTWKERWEAADWSVADYSEFSANARLQERFNRGGNDLSWLLARHIAGKIDSWDTVWAYTHAKYDALSLLPVVSKTHNIGLDGSGVHCRRVPFNQTTLSTNCKSSYCFPDCTTPDPHFAAEIGHLHNRSVLKKVGRFVSAAMGLRVKVRNGTALNDSNTR